MVYLHLNCAWQFLKDIKYLPPCLSQTLKPILKPSGALDPSFRAVSQLSICLFHAIPQH